MAEQKSYILDEEEAFANPISITIRGGPGSGHRGHKGRPGEVGGSVPDIGGRTIKDLLHVPRTERWNDIRVALDLIDQVHVMDETVFKLPLKASKSYRTGGMYRYLLRTSKPKDMFVVLNEFDEEDEYVQMCMLHEVGHWIDHAMLGNKHVFASPEYVTHVLATPDAEALEQWRAALKDSEAMKALIDYKGGSVDVSYETVGGFPASASYYYDFQFLRNAQTWKEGFARAYAQWVAYKTQDPGMIRHYENELRGVRAGAAPITWEWDDFQPIADSMDEIFRSRGWLKE